MRGQLFNEEKSSLAPVTNSPKILTTTNLTGPEYFHSQLHLDNFTVTDSSVSQASAFPKQRINITSEIQRSSHCLWRYRI